MKHKAQSGSDRLSESDAIRLAQQGDEHGFERLYQLYYGRVHALCLRMVRNEAEAEELTQEAFLQVFRKVYTFRAYSLFSSWLYRLTANTVLMRLRIKSLVDSSVEELAEKSNENGRPSREFGGDDPSLSYLLDRLRLQCALDQLPPGYKQIFILHDIQGYEHHEIATILGCSMGNSKSQLFKARLRMRTFLEEDFRDRGSRKKRSERV